VQERILNCVRTEVLAGDPRDNEICREQHGRNRSERCYLLSSYVLSAVRSKRDDSDKHACRDDKGESVSEALKEAQKKLAERDSFRRNPFSMQHLRDDKARDNKKHINTSKPT
jgi:hypothetical protein